MKRFPIEIDSVVDLLGLERDPKGGKGDTYRVRCPFCHSDKYTMHVDRNQNVYNCFHCGGHHTGGGALDLFSRVALGRELIPGSTELGGNGHYVFAKLAEALKMNSRGDSLEGYSFTRRAASISKERTTDANLNHAYSAILNFPWFELTPSHYDNLIRRGLDNDAIVRNGYRSISSECDWVSRYPEECAQFNTIDNVAISFSSLKRLSKKQRTAGFIIGRYLEQQQISMDGVPGFFRLNGQWCFRLETGMLIPTRNQAGEIVGLQVRKDKGDIRYMTISSKGLPDSVTSGISRIHFPLSNAPMDKKTKIYITEGPLKADVASFLIGASNILFVAVQGVQNTKELSVLFETAKKAGISKVYNCYDMDKLTNPHVAAASRKLQNEAKKYGLTMRRNVWDIDFAKQKWLELYGLCRYYNLFPKSDRPKNVFSEVACMAELLHQYEVQHSHYWFPEGVIKKYWSEKTKGIDDFLLAERKQ